MSLTKSFTRDRKVKNYGTQVTKITQILLVALTLLSSINLSARKFEGVDLRDKTSFVKDIGKNNYIVAYFLSATCPCSQGHFDLLNNLQKEHSKFDFIGFHSNKTVSKEKGHKYFKKFKIDFPILLDKSLSYANEFGALKTPHIFVISPSGKVVYQGGATNSRNPKKATKFYLKEALDSIKNKTEIKISKSKALGCFIQR
jgi:peroxiredoxin